MKKNILLIFIIFSLSAMSFNSNAIKTDDIKTGFIYIENNQFMVDGKRIWINGANTPWDRWNDFGGAGNDGGYNPAFWDAEFARLKAAGINSTRIWINCNGYGGILLNTNGTIRQVGNGNSNPANNTHWQRLDSLFNLAAKHKIYIMATLLSFDHFKTSGNHQGERWRALLTNRQGLDFAENYTIPFVNRYKNNPYLWSIDIMNEPDWVFEESRIRWDHISHFLAVQAAAIRENSNVLITVGMAYSKWNTGNNNPTGSNHAQEGNKVSDTYLQGLYNNPNAKLDFWSPHYYEWVGEWYGVPHYLTPSGNRTGSKSSGYGGGWGLDPSKPALIGECSGKGTTAIDRGHITSALRPPTANTIITDYEYAYLKGWHGVMAWTSNGVDNNGNLNDFRAATEYMANKYPALIFPHGR
ncbi:MAG: cellulase family glycosylhydrolase [Treponema sp.]|nr:cellulase family glycosylhydrolase [Treponema sp.]